MKTWIIGLVTLIPCVCLARGISVPGDYGTIQEAVLMASSGDTIVVEAGDYSSGEPFDLEGIKVFGQGPGCSSITLPQGGYSIRCSGDSELAGFDVVGGDIGCTISGGEIVLKDLVMVSQGWHIAIGAMFETPQSTGKLVVDHVTICDASRGMSGNGNIEVKNSIFTGCTAALDYENCYGFSLVNHHNVYWGNQRDYSFDAHRGPNELHADPLLDASSIPSWNSPCIDFATDAGSDGTAREIGAVDRFRAGAEGYFGARVANPPQTREATFRPGDHFQFTAGAFSTDPYPQTVELYVVLDVYEDYYFWGGGSTWTHDPVVSWVSVAVEPGVTDIPVLDFTWPEGAGSASGIRLWTCTGRESQIPWNPTISMATFSFEE